MKRRARLAVAVVTAAILAACAHTAPAPAAVALPRLAPAPVAPGPAVSGVWDWVYRSTDEAGDLRVEQEEWHLDQHGVAVDGWYDRAVTVMSQDERLYRCNQKLGFTKFTRVKVAGSLDGDKLKLRELSFAVKPGPCDDGARTLVDYVGTAGSAEIKLSWGPHEGQTLYRRESKERPALAVEAGVTDDGLKLVEARPASDVPVTGDWEWELKSVTADGEEQIERERWHLDESQDGLTGYYDRDVTKVRPGAVYPCSKSDSQSTSTRYRVHGQRVGARVMIAEVGYETRPSACDNGTRRLDVYQGEVSSDGDDLVLSWGPGLQLLHRMKK